MQLDKVLFSQKLARSRTEAQRLIRQGAVSAGACDPTCSFFKTGKCDCGGWTKITDPQEDINPGWCVKVGNGFGRTVARIDGRPGFDQLNGVCKVPGEIKAVGHIQSEEHWQEILREAP